MVFGGSSKIKLVCTYFSKLLLDCSCCVSLWIKVWHRTWFSATLLLNIASNSVTVKDNNYTTFTERSVSSFPSGSVTWKISMVGPLKHNRQTPKPHLQNNKVASWAGKVWPGLQTCDKYQYWNISASIQQQEPDRTWHQDEKVIGARIVGNETWLFMNFMA